MKFCACLALLGLLLTAPIASAAGPCGEAKYLSPERPEIWQMDPLGSARLELDVTVPAMLILESESADLELLEDPCGGSFRGRVLHQSQMGWILTFAEPGIHQLRLQTSSRQPSKTRARWIEAQVATDSRMIDGRDQRLSVEEVQLYADGLSGSQIARAASFEAGPPGTGRHLATFAQVRSDDGNRRAEISYLVRTRRGRTQLVATARSWSRTWKIEEGDIDPDDEGLHSGGVSNIEEGDIDPDDEGFRWTATQKIEEGDIDPDDEGLRCGGVSSIEEGDIDPDDEGLRWAAVQKIEEGDIDPDDEGLWAPGSGCGSMMVKARFDVEPGTNVEESAIRMLASLLWPELGVQAYDAGLRLTYFAESR